MKTRIKILSGITGLLAVTAIGTANTNSPAVRNIKSDNSQVETSSVHNQTNPAKPICDGVNVTSFCSLDGITYSSYLYHPAVPEKSHVVTSTSYQQKQIGSCTLCNDGTYSPSCATGRGACSYHAGVQVWNAPQYTSVPVMESHTVIDAPAQPESYDKVVL